MSMPTTSQESSPRNVMIHQDSFAVLDKLEDMAQEICAIDARLQYCVRESFSFTKHQMELAEKYSLRIQHHVHDLIIYSMMILDIHVCASVLLGILRVTKFVSMEEWTILIDEIYLLYSPFINLYVPDISTGRSWVISLVQEARGMYLLHNHLFHAFPNKSCHRKLFQTLQVPLF